MILPDLPDRLARDAAASERERNVVVDAGAGTGKTGLLVRRFVQLVAPSSTATTPIDVGRIAAITFTRRAAGDLGLRLRQELHSELVRCTDVVRRRRLREAISGFDGAYVGTIHSFCDRVLRPHAAEARLPALYDVVEDCAELVRETVDLLLRGTRDGTLRAQLPGVDEILVEEAGPTLRDIPRCGLLLETQETPRFERFGLDSLVDALVRSRDVQPLLPAYPHFEPTTFRSHAREFLDRVEPIAHLAGPGVALLRRIAETVRALEREEDPVVLFGAFARPLGRREPLQRYARRADLADDDSAWEAWGAIFGSTRRNPPRVPPLRDDLLAPLREWLAARLVRLQPVVVGAYEIVKQRRGCLDPLDLLLVLRDLLQRDRTARGSIQERFDHLLVDEFQDTDPLQAEILLYLGEAGAHAADAGEVRLRPGRLTVVGDPKQSIYRFRRADIRMYDEVTTRLASEGAARFTLSASLRTDPALVSFLDERFLDILGQRPAGGERFDGTTGRAFHEPLQAGRGAAAGTPRVHVVPIMPIGTSAEDFRRVEAEALAHYLHWLVTESGETIPVSATERRPVRYGDVAILAAVTTNVGMLAGPFDAQGIPYSLSGGRLFLQDELHRRFVLGLRAIADREDGVAEAALLMPPFFALDHEDILRERRNRQRDPADPPVPILPAVARAREALSLVSELRRRRLSRLPGETARDLLEQSAIGRVTALGPNGRQRLAGLRELCFTLERIAARDRLDYDGATAVLREWIERPVQLDPPPPIDEDAVRILTVHQAKGLEFPVVVLWDCKGTMRPRNERPVWLTSPDGSAWTIGMDGLAFEQPPATDLVGTERAYQSTERERLQYVAATRARDLLVVPCDGDPAGEVPGAQSANRRLLEDSSADSLRVLAPFREEDPPTWAQPVVAPGSITVEPGTPVASLDAAIRDARRPRLSSRAVSVVAWENAGKTPPDEVWAEVLAKADEARRSRFGSQFGSAVHRAIGLALRLGTSPEESIRRVSPRVDLAEHHREAALDVARALATLASERIAQCSPSVRLEYPVAGTTAGGDLLVGTIDLLAARETEWLLVDFKTDSTQGANDDAFLPYEEQVRLYASLLRDQLPANIPLRLALLFTETGELRWVERTR